MTTKIRRCLYIGLGGVGITSILHTKKLFTETYGEAPPMIGFLGIDTDQGAFKKEPLHSKYGKIALNPGEQLHIHVKDAKAIYKVNIDHFGWIPPENLFALTSIMAGAGQIRTNGRFALTVNYQEVENKVKTIINDITNANIRNNSMYQLLDNTVEIHVVCSLCGGTGSGTFLNLAYLLRQCAPGCKLTGYGVLADVFEAMLNAGIAKIKPNAYGAIQDLDRLMHLDLNSSEINLGFKNYKLPASGMPFDAFFLIDNKNANNDTYHHVDQLAEMASFALVTSAGELSAAAASVMDNLHKNIITGSMDIENKKAWAAGMGVCEILFQGEDLQKIYSFKAANGIIDLLLNSCKDYNSIANNWIDSKDVKIRENKGEDNVIDFLLDKNPPYPLTGIGDKSNAKVETDAYSNSVKPKDEDITKKIDELDNRVCNQLYKLLIEEINQECGVHAAESIISEIRTQTNIFLDEMNKEEEELKNIHKPNSKSMLDLTVKELTEYNKKFFKPKLEEYCNQVIDAANNLAICEREIIRRKAAITFFIGLLKSLDNHGKKIKTIEQMLLTIKKSFDSSLANIQNGVGYESQTFRIDLTQRYVNRVVLNPADISISSFLNEFSDNEKIYSFDVKQERDIAEIILNYTYNLPESKKWGNTTVDAVLNDMDEETFNETLRVAIHKSEPLFAYDYRGYMPQEYPADIYYIGVADKKVSRLNKENYFKSMLQNNPNIDFANTGMTNRVIIYRQIGVLPAFTLASLASYVGKYENCSTNPHFDAGIRNRMQREDYNLQPKAAVDDSLGLWVKGFIFGLIKNESDNYYFKSDSLGDPLDENWVELKKYRYRDEAFAEFKQHLAIVRKEFDKYFKDYQRIKGIEAMQAKIDEAKTGYYDAFSQINMSKDEVRDRGNESIRDLITKELDYVKKEL